MGLAATCFVAEITVVIDGSGTTQTFYFGTSGFATAPADTPANQVVYPRLQHPGSIQREAFSGARVTGAVRPSFGELVLINADGALDAWIGYGVAGGRVRVLWGPEGGAYPSAFTLVYVAYIHSMQASFDALRFALRDRLWLLDRPVVSSTFAGTGGPEGVSAGRRKQMVFGLPGLVPLVPVEPEKGIWFVQANAPGDGLGVGGSMRWGLYDAGARLSFETAVSAYSQLTGVTAGNWRCYRAATGPVYVQVPTALSGELRIGAVGGLRNAETEALRPWRFTDLCQRAGLSDVTTAALASGSLNPVVGDRLVDDDQTYTAVMQDAARAQLLAFGFNASDAFFARQLLDPADSAGSSDTVKFRFTLSNSANVVRIPVPDMESPVYQVMVAAGGTWPCSCGTSAAADVRAELSRTGYYTAFSGTADDVRAANPGALSEEIGIAGRYFSAQADQQAFVDAYIRLYGGRRDFFTLTCMRFDATTLALELLDKVELEMPRYNCSPARTFRIITIRLDLQARTITFGLWGGSAGPSGVGAVTLGAGSVGASGTLVDPGGSAAPVDSDGASSGNSTSPAPTLPACEHVFSASVSNGADGSATLPAAGHMFVGTVSGAVPAFTVYEAEDTAPGGVVTSGPAAARSAFMARLTVSGVIDWESYSDETVLTSLTPACNGVTLTLSDPAEFGNVVQADAYQGIFNTTSGGSKFAQITCAYDDGNLADFDFRIDFSTAIAAFGAYITDPGDYGGQFQMVLEKSGGGTTAVDITHTVGGASGNLVFWGFVDDTGQTYTALTIRVSNGNTTPDAIALDDVVVATAAQLA